MVLQLTQAMRGAILNGRLAGGTRLPSTRVLAKATGLGRSTVVEVIEQLAMEGYHRCMALNGYTATSHRMNNQPRLL